MSFGGLPAGALKVLSDKPEILGANAAQALAKLSGQGRDKQVVSAIEKLASGEIDQGQAIRFAKTDLGQKTIHKTSEPLRIKTGKAVYCDVLRADKVLRIVFNTAEDAVAAQDAIHAVLQGRADGKSKNT